MLSVDDARSLAREAVDRIATEVGVELQIVDEETLETLYGWIFFYNSKRFLETDEFQYALAGNGPLLVENATGRVVEFGTAYPVEEYLEHYEKTGEVLR